ncbi:MAG: response regulator transcription factor [Anaerolineae bacterium]
MNDKPIRVIVVDDHSMVHIGLSGMMEVFDDVELVGDAHSAEEGLAKIQELKPDVVLMDLVLPNMSGIEATRRVKADNPLVQVLILTSYENPIDIQNAIAAGAVGYLLKNVTASELERAIRAAAEGRVTLAPEAAKALVAHSQSRHATILTERELQVLGHLARGMSNAQIATLLFVSPFTIKAHVSNILAKLEVSTRAEAAAYAVQHNLVKLGNPK